MRDSDSKWNGSVDAAARVARNRGNELLAAKIVQAFRIGGDRTAPYRDEVLDAEWAEWRGEGDALRSLVALSALLYESYRGGPFGVCQRSIRHAERMLWSAAATARRRFEPIAEEVRTDER